MKNVMRFISCISVLVIFFLCGATTAWADVVTGTVTDATGESLPGATVSLKGNSATGVATNIDGKFQLQVPDLKNAILVVSYVGYKNAEVRVNGRSNLNITMTEDSETLSELVVVGYGQQKKASLVGAITQATGAVLERAGGVSSIGAALTGNLPGVVTTSSTGMPGEEDPQIIIRGVSSWNGSDPLILVDGVERPMSSVDISSVATISVLKDASATAVYGVKGANGVILITTKRGEEGKAKISVGMNMTAKVISQLPGVLDSYDALCVRNTAIERELGLEPGSWDKIVPMDIVSKYRNPANLEEAERYPNVDWQKALFKDYAMAYNPNVNIAGGTKFVKYFASVDFLHEGDLFREYENNRGYQAGYVYNRINARSNLDFQITRSTVLKANIAGMHGQQKHPWGMSSTDWSATQLWQAAYSAPPNTFLPQYSDGAWGYYPSDTQGSPNSMLNLATSGIEKKTTTRINTDFILEQDLSFITKGLKASAMVSWDNLMVETGRGINENYSAGVLQKWIDPETGEVHYSQTNNAMNNFDFSEGLGWSAQGGSVSDSQTYRNLYYQAQIYWGRKFGLHDVSAMGVFSRNESATGSEFTNYREDWAFRATYNFDERYFFEYNGAYNGSEKFGPNNRFKFFNSGAAGWMISKEKFMKFSENWLDLLKVRYSIGQVGDDNITTSRWLYATQWSYGNNATLSTSGQSSPYTWYTESVIGNPDIHWETAVKKNLGFDYSFLKNLFAGSLEFFNEKRSDILVVGSNRAIPSYFGGTAPAANLGKMSTKGYELELRLNYTFHNGLHLWGNFNMTHAENKVLQYDDAELTPAYQKTTGYAYGQDKVIYTAGYAQTWDQVAAIPKYDTGDNLKMPGQLINVDYNADGKIDKNDNTPYGYTGNPENTYNATLGFEYKGWSAFVQFYGVTNVNRYVGFSSMSKNMDNIFVSDGSYWSSSNPNADSPLPRWNTSFQSNNYYEGMRYHYDGSYIRLKNAEIAYTWHSGWVKRMGLSYFKLFLNGNNLWVWTRMPDDRESNFAGTGLASQGAYPTLRRFNLGFKFDI